jgi:hypothetical protein
MPGCGCEPLQVSDSLWLCDHTAFGRARYYAGAVDEARRMLALNGGYQATLSKLKTKKRQGSRARASEPTRLA